MQLVDEIRKVFCYQAEGKIINKKDLEILMKIWITELDNTDLIIRKDWLRNMKSTIDWNKKIISLKNIQIKKISDWLKNLKKVFRELSEEELLFQWLDMNHIIELTQDQISLSSLIPERSSDHELIREYLGKMLKKEWIKISNSVMKVLLFLIPKSEERRSVVDYRKLNSVI